MDQAASLRKLVATKKGAGKPAGKPSPEQQSKCQIVALGAGKGGVGKSVLTLNVGLALVQRGAKVLILDADGGMSGLETLLGLQAVGDLEDVGRGKHKLEDLVLEIQPGLNLMPSSSDFTAIGRSMVDPKRVRESLLVLEQNHDYLLVDAPAGLDKLNTALLKAADLVLLVTTDDPSATVAAYGFCKSLLSEDPKTQIKVIVNNAGNAEAAEKALRRLNNTVQNFLDTKLLPLGSVPHDQLIVEAAYQQKLFLQSHPESQTAAQIQKLAELLDHGPDWSTGKGFSNLLNLLNQVP